MRIVAGHLLTRRGLAAIAMGIALTTGMSGVGAETREEFWPEFDAFYKLDNRTRLFLMSSATRGEDTNRENGDTRFLSGQVGASLDFTLRPFFRTRADDDDWELHRFFWMRIGYRYLADFDSAAGGENRGLIEFNTRHPVVSEFWLTGRVKWEMRDIDGQYSNRYGVRLGAERAFSSGERTLVPYANVELLYDARFDAWNRQRYQAGIDIGINAHWRIEPYLLHQDDSRSDSAHLNALGITLKYSQ